MSDSLIRNLRDLASCAHADLSVADEAADEIERLRDALRKIAEWDLTGTAVAALGEKE